jgi:hypothetical protein
MKTKKQDNYSNGRKAEKKVAAKIKKEKSATVTLNPGSRGAEDLKVTFNNGRKQFIQVKSSSNGKAKMPSSTELGRLKSKSTRNGARAVVALVDSDGVRMIDAHSRRRVM